MRYAHNRKPPKVEAAASSDQTRPALSAAWFDSIRAELQVTDSYIAARVPVAVEADEESGFVQVEALKASRKRDAGGLHINEAVEVMPACWDGDAAIAPIVSFPREDRGQFPNLEQLWPAGEPAFVVGVNAGFLKRLADALGADDGVVELRFQPRRTSEGNAMSEPDPLRPIVVRPKNGADSREASSGGLERAEGLLMPVRVA